MKSILRGFALIFLICVICGSALAVKPPAIFTTKLAAGQNGVAYSATVKAKFGTKPYSWSISSGALPDGLSIAAATGIISGTPTVNNTFAFTVRVTDSEGPPKTDDQGLFITITGAAPAPTPAASISTGSLPSGQVSVAYTTTLQATGGTAPYTWSIPATCVAPSCGLPPGIALTGATGVVAGTPTASGTYSVTFTVTDSSATPQTYSKAFAVTIAASPGAPIFSDALSSFAAWTQVWTTTDDTIVACPDGGNCAQFHYVVCGDSTNPACGSAHGEANRYVQKNFNSTNGYPNGLPAFYLRGYVRFHQNAGGSNEIQRKLFYLKDPYGTTHDYHWAVVVNGRPASDWAHFGIGYDAPECSGGPAPTSKTSATTWAFDTWYSVEVYVKPNTPGLSDGELRVYVNGTELTDLQSLNVNLRGTCTTGINRIAVGTQVDRFNYLNVDEYRYWKNIVISTTGPIGP